jgi:hypothetical protein
MVGDPHRGVGPQSAVGLRANGQADVSGVDRHVLNKLGRNMLINGERRAWRNKVVIFRYKRQ